VDNPFWPFGVALYTMGPYVVAHIVVYGFLALKHENPASTKPAGCPVESCCVEPTATYRSPSPPPSSSPCSPATRACTP
jgi:hypothetical protein